VRPLLGFPYPEEAGLAPLWAAGVAREGKDEETAPTEAVGCIMTAGREGKMEILAKAGRKDLKLSSAITSAEALFDYQRQER
jgi:hypothetical protein